MRKRRFTEEQIVGILKEAERLNKGVIPGNGYFWNDFGSCADNYREAEKK